ncbi:hypothetical protein HMN09_00714700 [Mycena chlorophos]|uniref:RING-type E3 ubiquitin transferase n=1 Tax=Mycena chlorophos TaxID=658473 RepID=A0A8H6SZ36_MYCCL|nr:hypothetical protein HMN09_00714700 [Mycena chlorophos]
MAAPTQRPVTSKARGVCRYWDSPRGCFAGKDCKFLHGPSATHTPYDKAKVCRWYKAGFCKRGTDCWFAHERETPIPDEDDLCSVCFERPDTYGLLTGCGHIFCLPCLKQWRSNPNPDVVESGNTKRCPMCRTESKFIVPSSKFYVHGHPDKEMAITRYKASMKRVDCKHFQRSLETRSTPFCPYGRDCFYRHRNPDGTEYNPTHGIDSFRFGATDDVYVPGFARRADIMRSLETVFAQTAQLGLVRPFRDGEEDGNTVMHRLELLADHMLASLANRDPEPPRDVDTIVREHFAQRDAAILREREERNDDDAQSDNSDDMPMLASVSVSSAEGSDEEDDSDDHGSGSAVRPFDLAALRRFRDENIRRNAIHAAEGEGEVAAASSPRAPPFVTDGRGRVVWSTSETAAEGIASNGTQGAGGNDTEGANEGEESRPRESRSFLGRMLNAFF